MKKQVTFFICTIILLALSSCHKEADYSLNNSIWIHQFQAEELRTVKSSNATEIRRLKKELATLRRYVR
jgi:hypothetical protein